MTIWRLRVACCIPNATDTHSEHVTLTAVPTTTMVWPKPSQYYEACPESKDTSRVGRWGNFLCLLWQHWRRP
jgi:hypothetical protein